MGPLATVGWAALHAGRVLDGEVLEEHATWVGALGLGLDVRLDGFGLVMVALVSGVGAVVFAYALAYFRRSTRAVGRLGGLLTLFSGAMLGLVLADNLLLLYACWELTSVTSYLLIGNTDRDPEARGAALHALLVTGAGGLALLGGFVLLGESAGTYRLSALLDAPPTGGVATAGLVLVLVGAFTKSAQYPFHSWLPGAMVAPTPVSAYLHSAAMVKAGVYLVGRFAPAVAGIGPWRPLIVVVGLTTMVGGGLRALRRYDLKQLLAFGTVSQLGFLMVLFGLGKPELTVAGCALLIAHGAFKAVLFMVVGIVDHQAGTRDMRRLPRLGAGWGPTKVVAVVSAASMAGLPPLAGFIAKEEAYTALLHGSAGDRVVLAGVVAGSVLTMAYSLRFVSALLRPTPVVPVTAAARAGHEVRAASHPEAVAAEPPSTIPPAAEPPGAAGAPAGETPAAGIPVVAAAASAPVAGTPAVVAAGPVPVAEPRGAGTRASTTAAVGEVADGQGGVEARVDAETPGGQSAGVDGGAGAGGAGVPAPAWGFLAPAWLLALVTVGFGLVPAPYSALVDAGAHALDGAAHAHLAPWHGLGTPLLLSAVTIAAGAGMFLARRPVATVQAALAPQASALGAYEASVRGLTRFAQRATRISQPGSLPVYLSVIVLTAVVVPGLGLVFGAGGWSGWPEMVGEPAYIPAAALLVGGAVAAAFATRRFTAALLLGVVGYGMALLFVIMGAPDLALTQFAIETLSVVMFLLVLRRLPDAFQPRGPSPARWARMAVGATVAAFVFVLALATGQARTAEPRSGEMVERAYEDGGGHNVVNVILVEFRGFDTLGEVTVLAVAAVGTTAIARAGRRPPGARAAEAPTAGGAGGPGAAAGRDEDAGDEPGEPGAGGDDVVGVRR